ncbi:hypothetical protein [Falsihalocynthiibacter arcticus]|uniref:hypothetical protein n=1 Tax=Falsihalocynthiibacter arcticus TaxID=1579316 RepID=UPI0012E8B2BE|nr:hypothetical protein [Falsihalocynthiibacter arcticus]
MANFFASSDDVSSLGTQALNVTNTTENQTQNPRALDFFNITSPNGFNSDMRSHPIAVTHDVPQ